LTAAHCVNKKENALKAYLGLILKSTKEQSDVRNIIEIEIHPKYRYPYFDIALVKMNQPVNNIRPIYLPTDSSQDYVGFQATATGWGLTIDGKYPDKLQKITNMEVLTNARCQHSTEYSDTNAMVCANVPRKVGGTCSGDSGGPLIVKDGRNYVLIGVTSHGVGSCYNKDHISVFARVTSVLEWIDDCTS